MITIENEILKVEINSLGAELQSLYNKATGLNYLWNGDPAFWGKHSPVLFPIVGTLKNNTYSYQGKKYSLPRHGFAREKEFQPEELSDREAVFLLRSDASTKAVYPFDFEFRIHYQLTADELSTVYAITNTGTDILLFSVGGHPAFRLPLTSGTRYDDYYLQFEEMETLQRWPISGDGLITENPVPYLRDQNILPLKKSLFYGDALVFKYPASSEIFLRSSKTSHGLLFQCGEFPFLGIWAAKDADFICIEPWCGIADSVNSSQILDHKEGIEKLMPGKTFNRQWRVKLF